MGRSGPTFIVDSIVCIGRARSRWEGRIACSRTNIVPLGVRSKGHWVNPQPRFQRSLYLWIYYRVFNDISGTSSKESAPAPGVFNRLRIPYSNHHRSNEMTPGTRAYSCLTFTSPRHFFYRCTTLSTTGAGRLDPDIASLAHVS